MQKNLSVVALLVTLLFTSVSFAGQDEALAWLSSKQDSLVGSISQESDIGKLSQSSYEAARTLSDSLGDSYESEVLHVVDFLSTDNVEDSSTELLAQRVTIKSHRSLDMSTETTELLQRISTKDSVGFLSGYDANLLEEVWALQGLGAAGVRNTKTVALLDSLILKQNINGSFQGFDSDDASIYLTSQAIVALQSHRAFYNLDAPLDKAATFLKSFKQSSDHWGTSYYNALALLALVPSATELIEYQAAIDYLKNNQLGNGSWQNDVYITALVTRAISLVDSFVAPATVTTGSAKGRVVDSINGQPLDGVSVTAMLAGQPDVQVQSNLDGSFEFPELESGDYELVFTISGFTPRTGNVTIGAKQRVVLGDISLAPAIGVIIGRIVRNDTGEPILNAMIAVTGATVANVMSDANGEYYVVAQPGTSSIAISASGFQGVSGTGAIDAGGILNFSPRLLANNTTPINTASDVFGVVIDQTTGMPITDALVSVIGQALNVQTNAQGEFTLLQLNDGAVQLSISKTGYATNNYDLIIPQAANVDIGTLNLYPQQQSAVLSIISGEVLDIDTNLPVPNAVITLSSGEEVRSDLQGSFTLEDITAGNYQLTVSGERYLDSVVDIALRQGELLQIGRLFLKERDVPPPTSTVRGVVSDKETGLPIAGVKVSISGTNLSTTSIADGSYEIAGIETLSFQLFVQLTGYLSEISNVVLQEHTNTQLDVTLKQASLGGIEIDNLQMDQTEYQAYKPVVLTTDISNGSDKTQRVSVLFQIKNSNGDTIFNSSLGGVTGNQINSEIITITPNNSDQISTQWFTGVTPPGTYETFVRVFDGLTNQLLAERLSTFTILETKALSSLELKAVPLFANVGEEVLVTFDLHAVNRSNVLYDVDLTYKWFDSGNVQLRSVNKVISFSPETAITTIELDSFPYTFPVSGEYPAELNVIAGPSPEKLSEPVITVAPSVRVEASQDITPKKVLPDGDKRIKLNIRVKGVEQ